MFFEFANAIVTTHVAVPLKDHTFKDVFRHGDHRWSPVMLIVTVHGTGTHTWEITAKTISPSGRIGGVARTFSRAMVHSPADELALRLDDMACALVNQLPHPPQVSTNARPR
jgi:hypothetical protein